MKRWGINNEHAQARSCKDTDKVVVIPYDGLAEWEREFGFDGEDLEIGWGWGD